jgi:WD40 repeat protein
VTPSSAPSLAAALDRENPWPGLESFDERAREYFNGRGGETEDLLRRVVDAPVTVLFGKSGLGKTSLLRAGLFPRLREQHFLPVHVRLDVRPSAPRLVDQLRDALGRTIAEERVEATEGIQQGTLWEYLHRADLELWSVQNHPLIPVLVIDQFEEVFTLGEGLLEEVERFKVDFGDLAENRIPKALESRLATDSAAAHSLDLRAMPYKLLLSLREDFLPHLEGWRSVVPSLGRIRMRLLPMRPAQAFAAVYETAPHLMDAPVARRIVQFVAAAPSSAPADAAAGAASVAAGAGGGDIEPALLSLFCRGLNERRQREGKARFDDQLLEGAQEGIILDYYRSCVEDLPDRASRFIETELITAKGFRNSYARDDAVPAYLTPDQLDRLIDQRLLRLEDRYGTVRIELTHDLLTKAVLEQRRLREVEEEKAALVRRGEEERQALAARARDERRRFLAVVVAAIVCLAFATVAAWQWRVAARAKAYADFRRGQAEEATGKAEAAKAAAEDAQRRALKAKGDAETARGEANTQKSFAELARQSAEQQARIATARELAATAVPMVKESFDNQGDLPVLLAMQAVAATYPADGVTREAEDALRRAVGGGTTSLSFPGHSRGVGALAFSPDGTQLATCSDDDTVRVWNVAGGEQLQRHDGGRCDHLAFGAAGIRLGLESQLNVSLRPLSGPPLLDVQLPRGFFRTGLRLSANGGRAAFTNRGALVVVETASNRKLLEIPANAWASPVALSGDGARLAYLVGSGAASTTRIADVDSGREVQTLPKTSDARPALSYHGDLIAIEEPGAGVNICDVKAGSCRLLAFTDTIGGTAFSPPDGRVFAMFTNGDRVRLWDTASLEPIGEPIEGAKSIAFSQDGQRIAMGSGDSSARIWDVRAGKPVATLVGRADSRLRTVAFTDGATRLATGSDDRRLRVWEPGIGRLLYTVTSPYAVERIAISPTGDRVAGGVTSSDWRVWQQPSTQPADGVQLERAGMSSIAFAANGARLVGAAPMGQSEVVTLFDAQSGRGVAAPFGSDGETSEAFGRTLAISVNQPQTRIATSGTREGVVLDTGSRKALLRIPELRWETVFGGPNGGWVAAAGPKGTDIWDVDARRKVNQHTMPGLSDGAGSRRGNQLALSHDGRRLAIVNEGGRTVSLWDTVTGARQASLYRHDATILAIAFARDDKHLAVALEDWTVHHHPLAVDDLLALGRKRVKRSLSPAECKTYLGNAPCPAALPAR